MTAGAALLALLRAGAPGHWSPASWRQLEARVLLTVVAWWRAREAFRSPAS